MSKLDFRINQYLIHTIAFIFQEDLHSLGKMVENSRSHNLSIWFGHYPLSTVSGHFSSGRNLLKYAKLLYYVLGSLGFDDAPVYDAAGND